MNLFFAVVMLVWTALHLHVGWHLSGLHVFTNPRVRWAIRGATALAWLTLPAMPVANKLHLYALGTGLSILWTNWLGVLFLMFACLLVIDGVTLGGRLLVAHTRWLRFGAAIAGVLLSVLACVQGRRDPVLTEYSITLPGLPAKLDGTRMLVLTDIHLGDQIGNPWLSRLAARTREIAPDLIVISGDLIDRDATRVFAMTKSLSELRAPLGTWVVQGNHDGYAGTDNWERIVREAGFRVLRNESALAAPGLRIAGVDDLGHHGGESTAPTRASDWVRKALAGHAGKADEACILLSHTPVELEAAEAAGAGLMVSGHTHAGQIWPFRYLVALRYKFIEGANAFGDMTVLISRGAGTWGPRMRLWQAGELPLVTLKSR